MSEVGQFRRANPSPLCGAALYAKLLSTGVHYAEKLFHRSRSTRLTASLRFTGSKCIRRWFPGSASATHYKDPTGPPIWINALFRHYRKSASQFVIRFPASQSFISNPSACEAVQFRTPPTFLLSGGHSAFPDQRMALFWARF
jgi:hypothetical protein